MRKNLCASCCFLLGLALLLGLSSWYFLPKNNTPEAGIQDYTASGFLAEPENSLEVVILGDSVPLCAFSPAVLEETRNIKSYVCASTGQDLIKSQNFLEAFFRTQSPKLVILEANHLYRDFSALDRYVDLAQDRVPVLRYHDGWKFLRPRQALSGVKYTQRIPERGYYEKTGVVPAPAGAYMIPTNGENRVPEQCRLVLERVQALCDREGATLLLLSAPSAANWDYYSHNGVAAAAEELGLPYVDMNLEAVGIDWSLDTVDAGDHLNGDGAKKASRWLAEYLAGSKTRL